MDLITEWIKRFDIQSAEMRDHLLPYLGTRTEQFQHEFYHFARSTYDLVGYDRHAEYSNRTYATEVVSSGESESEVARPDRRDTSIEIVNETRAPEALLEAIQLHTTTIPNLSTLAGLMQRNLQHSLVDWNKKDDNKKSSKEKHGEGRKERERRKNEEGRRKKNNKPSRFVRPRHFLEDSLDPASSGSHGSGSRQSPVELPTFPSHSNSPIDLSLTRDLEDLGPSTSRGISGGLTRLVIPDSDSDNESGVIELTGGARIVKETKSSKDKEGLGNQEKPDVSCTLVQRKKSADDREGSEKSKKKREDSPAVSISRKGGASEGGKDEKSRTKNREKGERSKHSGSKKSTSVGESEVEQSGDVVTNGRDTVIKDTHSSVDKWIEQSMQLQASDSAYLDPSAGLVEFRDDGKASPEVFDLNDPNSWEMEDELEVVDVVNTNLRKRNTEPEVVELIDDSDDDDTENINVDINLDDEYAGMYSPPLDTRSYTPPPINVGTGTPPVKPGGVVLNDEPINISSDDDEPIAPENDYRTIQDYMYDHPPPLRMSLYQPTASRWCGFDGESESDSDRYGRRGREKKKGKGKGKSTAKPRPKSSSSDDDLIVVKTEYNTIDPITKKEIVDPVRNKKCNHIYERETILQTIDVAKQNGKTVKCPYMGCNCRDFRKSDLIKDKDVLNHIVKVKQEKEVEAAKKKEEEKKSQEKRKEEREKRKVERKKKRKEEGRASSEESDGSVRSSDSIICEVLDMLKEKAKDSSAERKRTEGEKTKETEKEKAKESAEDAAQETASQSKEIPSEKESKRTKSKEKKKKKSRSLHIEGSDEEERIVPKIKKSARAVLLNESSDENDNEELSKRKKKSSKRRSKDKQIPNILKSPQKKTIQDEQKIQSDSDEPINRKKKKSSKRVETVVEEALVEERTKRKRRRPAFLDDSYSTDDECNLDTLPISQSKGVKINKIQSKAPRKSKPTDSKTDTSASSEHTPAKKLKKKVKIVGKKVTETTWVVEETEEAAPTSPIHEAQKTGKKKRKPSAEKIALATEAEVSPKIKLKKKVDQAKQINGEISQNGNQETRSKNKKTSKRKKVGNPATELTVNADDDIEENDDDDDAKNISRRGIKPVSYEEPGSDFDE